MSDERVPMPSWLRELARENFALLGVWTELTHVGWLERVDAAIDAVWSSLGADHVGWETSGEFFPRDFVGAASGLEPMFVLRGAFPSSPRSVLSGDQENQQ